MAGGTNISKQQSPAISRLNELKVTFYKKIDRFAVWLSSPGPADTYKISNLTQTPAVGGNFSFPNRVYILTSKSAGLFNLKKHVIDIISERVATKLENYCYYDLCRENELTTNDNDTDIIAHQLELKFENTDSVFISWATIDNWFQYSLCLSEKSFCSGAELFAKQDKKWRQLLGKALMSFDVYGYRENVITSTDAKTGLTQKNKYYLEPHLLILYFEGDNVLGIANFYAENDFIPKLPMGDDIWIVFGQTYIDKCIINLNLERISD